MKKMSFVCQPITFMKIFSEGCIMRFSQNERTWIYIHSFPVKKDHNAKFATNLFRSNFIYIDFYQKLHSYIDREN